MDYAKPSDVVASMVDASLKKLALAPRDIMIRGGFVFTSLALYATYKPATPTADVAQVAVQAAE